MRYRLTMITTIETDSIDVLERDLKLGNWQEADVDDMLKGKTLAYETKQSGRIARTEIQIEDKEKR